MVEQHGYAFLEPEQMKTIYGERKFKFELRALDASLIQGSTTCRSTWTHTVR